MSYYEIHTGRFLSFPHNWKTSEGVYLAVGLCCAQKWHHNNNSLKTVEIMGRQATLLGKTNSGIQIAKLIQWLWLNFPLQNNQIGCRGNLLPESQFYCRYFSPKVSFISPMQTFPPNFAKQESILKNTWILQRLIKNLSLSCFVGFDKLELILGFLLYHALGEHCYLEWIQYHRSRVWQLS